MADPWGPGIKRKVQSVDTYMQAWNALPTHEWMISYLRNKQGPIYIQEQLQVILNAMDPNGDLHPIVNASGEITEVNSNTNRAANTIARYAATNGNPLMWDAGGVPISSSASRELLPIPSEVGAGSVITADGAGNIGAAADVLPAIVGERYDLLAILQVSLAGSYTTKWCEDPTGTPAVGTPDYHTNGHIVNMVAGYPYLLRAMTITDNMGFGFDAGVNGNWPNNA